MTEQNSRIVELGNQGVENIDVMVREYYNCMDCEIDYETGTVWIATPQQGHYLSDDDIDSVVDWMVATS